MEKDQNQKHPENRTQTAGTGTNADRGGKAQSGINPSGPTAGTESSGSGSAPGQNQTGKGERTFRCADVGNADCRWETTGRMDEIMPRIEEHGREAHGIQNFDDNTKKKIHNAIRERNAA